MFSSFAGQPLISDGQKIAQAAAVARLLGEHGSNVLPTPQPPSLPLIFLRQFLREPTFDKRMIRRVLQAAFVMGVGGPIVPTDRKRPPD